MREGGSNTTSAGAQTATNPWTYAGGYNDTTNNRIKFGARAMRRKPRDNA